MDQTYSITCDCGSVKLRLRGGTMFNSNAAGWRVVSQLLIRKNYDDALPADLQSRMHFFYDRRIVDIDDELPKRP